MTEEEKTCECKECCKKAKEFLFLSGAVFVGGTLAILVGHALTKPKMPPIPPMMPNVGVERQMPQPQFGMGQQMPPQGGFHHRGQRPDGFQKGDFKKDDSKKDDFKGKPQRFDNERFPEPPMKDKK